MSRPFGIPTKHKGIQFRSMLEAKWARFFDSLGWKWAYEPYELNGYIPDFIIPFPKRELLVEVKPLIALTISNVPQDVVGKIERSGWTQPNDDGETEVKSYVIVGTDIFKANNKPLSAGVFNDAGWSFDNFNFARCLACKCIAPSNFTSYWGCPICGDSSKALSQVGESDDLIWSAWCEAKNGLQYKGNKQKRPLHKLEGRELLYHLDQVVRYVRNTDRSLAGWAHLTGSKDWMITRNFEAACTVLNGRFIGYEPAELKSVLVQYPWTLVNDPTLPEYPGTSQQRIWNKK